MKKSSPFKPDHISSKLIENLRQSYINKDIIKKTNNYENLNRGLSESKTTNNKPKNKFYRPFKKSEEPISRVTDENQIKNKSKERIDNGISNANKNNNSNSKQFQESRKTTENSNRSSVNFQENGFKTNLDNFSPKQGNKQRTTNYSKFANNSKHVKANSISSNIGLISSINILVSKKNRYKSKNDSSYNNISFENTNNIVTKIHTETDNNIVIDHNDGHIKNNSSNVNFNDSLNIINESHGKSTNKGSTASSITKAIQNNQGLKRNEIETPEELHFFYMNLYKMNKNLAYKFENLIFSQEEFKEETSI